MQILHCSMGMKGGQQKYVMQMKMVAEWHGAIT